MKDLKIKINILILGLILSSYILPSFIVFERDIKFNTVTAKSNSELITSEEYLSTPHNLNNWDELIWNYDKNDNGINDYFDRRLNFLGSSSSSVKLNSFDHQNIIIQFPNDFDYSSAILYFESEGGSIKYTYKEAINGFAGSINNSGFANFYEILKENSVPFFIECDDPGKSHLYYTSRNLRLRPDVWNKLNFTGDNQSSIAILDTGIDEEHSFFDNTSTGKVLKFVDFVNGLNDTAYDDNGHGSHVAGIAAGLGTTDDVEGRAVATSATNIDFSSSNISDGSGILIPLARFEVPSLGEIEIELSFNDTTPLPDYTTVKFYLIDEDTIYSQIGRTTPGDWESNITYDIISSSQLRDYIVAAIVIFKDGDFDNNCTSPNSTVRAEIHWPFSPLNYSSGNLWKGVAPNANLVAVKVVDESGRGFGSDVVKGVDWCIANRKKYNISVISMSLGYWKGFASLIWAVNTATENGIVVVVSAGNDGGGDNYVVSPGDADNVITVAANNFHDQITEYSSQGGPSSSTNTNKPDITAPGGSFNDVQMFSADTNDNDADGTQVDNYNNDLYGAQGTSMSCPAVAGAANLLIEAIRETTKWNWDGSNTSKLVKAILLMTATETYPLQREYDLSHSPQLNRGGKDVHEGYGRLNIDAAIEAWINDLSNPSANSINISVWLNTSRYNSFGKHAYAGYVDLKKGEKVVLNLTVPNGADYDIYLYNNTPNEYGEPVIINSSISSTKGGNEIINYTATHDGKFFLVVKAIGEFVPSGGNGNGDGKKTTVITFDILTIIIIIGIIALLAIVFVIILYKKGRKDDIYEFKPDY